MGVLYPPFIAKIPSKIQRGSIQISAYLRNHSPNTVNFRFFINNIIIWEHTPWPIIMFVNSGRAKILLLCRPSGR